MDSPETSWIHTLPDYVREALDVANDTLKSLDSQVRMGETLAKLAFRRAIDGIVEHDNKDMTVEASSDLFDDQGLTEDKVSQRLHLAIKANSEVGKLKMMRMEMLDRYSDAVELPKPANLKFHTVETPKEEQIERLSLLGYYKEAAAMRNGEEREECVEEEEE